MNNPFLPGENYNYVLDSLHSISNAVRLDDGRTLFFQRTLEHIEEIFYLFDLKVLKHRELIPVDFSAHPGAESITYRMYEKIGLAVIIASPSDDLPVVDVVGQEFTNQTKILGASFMISTEEFRRADMANLPIDQLKISAIADAISFAESDIAWKGLASAGLPGLLGGDPILPSIQAAPAAAGSNPRSWLDPVKTGDEIIADISAAITNIRTNSRGRRMPDTMLMSMDHYDRLSHQISAEPRDRTILEHITAPGNKFGLTTVDWVPDLDSLPFYGDVPVVVLYERDPQVLAQRIPMERVLAPAQPVGLNFKFPAEEKVGGVAIRYPHATTVITDA